MLRLAGVCGVIAPLVALSSIFLAIAYSPWFNWTDNALSDLGVGTAAFLFNSGLIVGGLLGLVFSLGMVQVLRKRVLGLAGAFMLVLAAVSLVGVGVFPETAGRIHFYVSVAFFAFGPSSLLLVGIALARESSWRKLGVFSVLTGAFAVAVWAVPYPYRGVAVPEMLASLSTSLWFIILGVKLFMQG